VHRKSAYLKFLAEAIRIRHGLPAVHVQTVFVSILDATNGQLQRDIEVFALMTSCEARKCFAWANPAGEPVILLATTDVNSPEQALRTIGAAGPPVAAPATS
jgi:hypothetical protein